MTQHSLSIIIPTYKGRALHEEFLPSVLEAAARCPVPVEILLVDDCSGDGSIEAVAVPPGSNLKLLSTPVNGGFSKTCNFGAARATGGILFFLNNDVRLDPDYFSTFPAYFDDGSVFALCPAGYTYYGGAQIDGLKLLDWRRGMMRFTGNIYNAELPAPSSGPYPAFGVQGAYFFCRADRFRELGGFDELYSPYIMEESDLCYRALKRGWKIVYGPEFRAWHKVGATIKSKVSSRAKVLSARNRLLFVWKNVGETGLLASHFFFLALRLLACNVWEWRGLFGALRLAGEALRKRRAEAAAVTLRDGEVIASCRAFAAKFGR